MGLCSLTHQIDALNILNELQAHATAINRDGEGPCSGAVPGDVMKEPRRLKTIAERARESCITRLLEILTRLISIEEDFIKDASYGRRLLKRKDSVDLKNICLRMAVAEGGSHSDRDLRELRDCLRLIVGNLLTFVREENNLSSTETTLKLRELSNSFPDI
ncbi:leukemia-associated protein 7 isoform X2 [Carassius auratus]|uniref:Leukemia-associated protein 7 isoform X2 n=1 Tax=Carassius auratus TaxID=7957 RepID=A0A6P6MET2_CARAU|nr:leukemia-associated protein 7-like isoform X2 [Carassius auratus]XP_052460099.1 leukemia-associated protein 7-like isoform X2 [Carassius gibelio]